MCVAVPGQVAEIDGMSAVVDFGGVKRKLGIDLVPDVQVGDWVIGHAGFILQQLDVEEAQERLQLFEDLEGLEE